MKRNIASALCVLSLAACAEEQVVVKPPPPPPPVVEAPPPPPEPPPPPPKPSLTELETTTLMTTTGGLNAHDAAKAASGYAEDALIRVAGMSDIEGRSALQANNQEWFDTLSNIKMGARRVWILGDTIVAEWVLTGNYTGTLFGTKGKDQPVGYAALSLFWFDGEGHIKEEHRYADVGAVAKQVSNKSPIPTVPEIPAAPQMFAPAADAAANVDVARSVYGAIENKNDNDLLARLTDDVALEGQFGKVVGKAEAKKFFASFAKAFPDARLTLTNAWGTADGAIVEYVLTGTQRGPILGLAPTNRAIAVHAVDVMKMAGGKVSGVSTYSNGLELLTELGAFKFPKPVVPPPPAAKPPPAAAKK